MKQRFACQWSIALLALLLIGCGNGGVEIKEETELPFIDAPDVDVPEEVVEPKCTSDQECVDVEDGDACNGSLICVDGSCVINPATVVVCPAPSVPCRQSTCLPSTGQCEEHTLPAGASCDLDDDICTLDQCTANGLCQAGEYDNANPQCPCLDDNGCNDDDACTDDTCGDDGVCQHAAHDCDDDIACTVDSCDSEAGQCLHLADDGLCDDEESCTIDSCDTAEGECRHEPDPACGCLNDEQCDDQDDCTRDSCNLETNECEFDFDFTDPEACPWPCEDETACDDDNACTDDACTASGHCRWTDHNCDDGEFCTYDDCDSQAGCLHVWTGGSPDCGCASDEECESHPAYCQVGQCSPVTHACEWVAAADATACDDNDACTEDDQCDSGVCIGTDIDCEDGDVCTIDVCTAGQCSHNIDENNPVCALCSEALSLEDGCQAAGGGDTTGQTSAQAHYSCMTNTFEGPETLFAYTAAANGTVLVTLTPTFDGAIVVLDAQCLPEGVDSCLAGRDETGDGGVERVSLAVTQGTLYYIVVEGWGGGAGTFDIAVTCVDTEDCSDEIDNDGDGQLDCADSDCALDPACYEALCADDIDNDTDGATDCDDSDCAADPACFESDCADGSDNDQDGATDCADSDCFADPACFESECGDGADNDQDGMTDCADADCAGHGACLCGAAPTMTGCDLTMAGSTAELTPQVDAYACVGYPLSGPELVYTFTAESDGQVQVVLLPEFDGALVLLDATCEPVADDSCLAVADSGFFGDPETLPLTVVAGETYTVVVEGYESADAGNFTLQWVCESPENDEARCNDGLDNDFDGAVDCFDTDCAATTACSQEMVCDDQVDNDADGLTDCADADCLTNPACVESDCEDLLDNDGDGATDCADSDCAELAVCGQACGPDIQTIGCGQVISIDTTGTPAAIDHYSCTEWPMTGPEVVLSFVPQADLDVQFVDLDDNSNVDLLLLEGLCRSASCIEYIFLSDTLTASLTAGTPYYFVADGVDGWQGMIHLQLRCPTLPEICDDALDNNSDGLIDCADPDCFGLSGCTTEALCQDALDNDDDGLADCADPDCFGLTGCTTETDCQDTLDNDDDGLADCADPDCDSQSLCHPVTNDSCAQAQLLGQPGTVSGTTIGAAADYPTDVAQAPDVFYQFTTVQPVSIEISMSSNPAWDTYLYLLSGSCAQLTLVAEDDDCGNAGVGRSCVTLGELAPGTYYIVASGYDADASGDFELTLSFGPPITPPANDTCDNAAMIGPQVGVQQIDGTTAAALHDYPPDVSPGAPDVWYTFRTTADYKVDFMMQTDPAWDTYLYLLSGSCGEWTEVAADDDCGQFGAGISCISLDELPAGTYYLVASGYDKNESGPFQLLLEFNEVQVGYSCDNPRPLATGNNSGDSSVGPVDIAWPTCSAADGRDDVWMFEADCEGTADFELDPNGWDSVLAAYSECGNESTILGCDDQTGFPESLSIDIAAGRTYYIVVTSYNASEYGTYSLYFAPTCNK